MEFEKRKADTEANTSFNQGLNSVDLLTPLAPKRSNGLIEGILNGAVNQPTKALCQLAGLEYAEHRANPESKANSKAQIPNEQLDYKIGEIVGSLAPFITVACATRRLGNRLLGEQVTPTFLRHVGEQATSGFIMGAVLTPSKDTPGSSLVFERIKQGAVSAGTFATMSGVSYRLGKCLPSEGLSFNARLGRSATIGALAGAAGGFSDVELRTGGKASNAELASSVLGYAVFGSLMEGVSTSFNCASPNKSGTVRPPHSIVESKLQQTTAAEQKITAIPELSSQKTPEKNYNNKSVNAEQCPKGNTDNTGDPEQATDINSFNSNEFLKNAEIVMDQIIQHAFDQKSYLPQAQLPQARHSVINEFKNVFKSTPDGKQFNLANVLMDTNWLRDNQKLRVLDVLCTIKDAGNSRSDTAKHTSGNEWLRIESRLADTFSGVIERAKSGTRTDSNELETELLANILSEIAGKEPAGPGPHSKLQNTVSTVLEAEEILTHAGFDKETLRKILSQLETIIESKSNRKTNADELTIKGNSLSEYEAVRKTLEDVWLPKSHEKFWIHLDDAKKLSSTQYPLKLRLNEQEIRFDSWDEKKKLICDVTNKQDRITVHKDEQGRIDIAIRYNVRTSKREPLDVATEKRFFYYDDAGKVSSMNSSIFGDWVCRDGKYWYQRLGSGPKGPKERYLFEGELVVDGNGDFRTFASSSDNVVRYGIDGTKEVHLSNGHIEYKSADLPTEQARLTALMKDQLNMLRFPRWNSLLSDYEHVASTDLNKQALFFKHLNRLVYSTETLPKLSQEQRRDLAEQILNHAAAPTTIDQGSNKTCTVASLENRLYTRAPEIAARIIADLARSGEFITRSGISIPLKNDASGIKPDYQARQSLRGQQKAFSPVKIDGDRDWASQLVQTVLAKIPNSKAVEIVSNGVVIEQKRIQFNSKREIIGLSKAFESVKPIYNAQGKELKYPDANTDVYKKVDQFFQLIPPSDLVYNNHGEIRGYLESPKDLIALHDKFGKPAAVLSPGEHYFDKQGKSILYLTRKGEMNYKKIVTGAQEREQITLDFLGRCLYLKEEIAGKIDSMNSPSLNGFDLRDIEREVSPELSNQFAIRLGKKFEQCWGGIRVSSVAEFEKALLKLDADNNFPGVLAVHTSKEPWSKGQSSHGNHAVNVQSYDPKTKTLRLSNQWGSKYDFLDKGVSLQMIFDSLID